jgi:hypothetical protein
MAESLESDNGFAAEKIDTSELESTQAATDSTGTEPLTHETEAGQHDDPPEVRARTARERIDDSAREMLGWNLYEERHRAADRMFEAAEPKKPWWKRAIGR